MVLKRLEYWKKSKGTSKFHPQEEAIEVIQSKRIDTECV